MKKKVIYVFIVLFSPVILYVCSAFVLSSITIGKKINNENRPYVAYVVSSDIHTEFIFPMKNDLFDWNTIFFKEAENFSYVSIGWGSREFFFEMQTWEEIKLKVILKAIFYPSDSVVHVDFLKKLPENEPLFPLKIGREDYLKLVQFVIQSFDFSNSKNVQQIGEFSYYGTDRFFKSSENYHLFNTCNMWTNRGLEAIGWRRPVWSPFKYGIESALRK